MANITLPASFPIRKVSWSLDRPSQINTSAWTGRRTLVTNPWHGKWRANVELAQVQGEANIRLIRSFLAQLKGRLNTFQLPATEGPQIALGVINPTISNNANTTVAAQGGGVYRVTKSGGVNATADASAVSAAAMGGDFTIRWQPSVAEFYIGCNADPLTDNASAGIDRAVRCYANGGTVGLQALENGGLVWNTGATAAFTDYLFIQRLGSTVKLLKGTTSDVSLATLLWTYNSYSSTAYFDSSLMSLTTPAQFDVLVTYSNSSPTLSANAGQGATSVSLTAPPSGLTAGMLATFSLPSGNKQMALLTADVSGTTMTFEPPLREALSTGDAVEVTNPTCQVALADSAFQWSVETWRLYGFSFAVEEVF